MIEVEKVNIHTISEFFQIPFADENGYVRVYERNERRYQKIGGKVNISTHRATVKKNYWKNRGFNSNDMESYLSNFESACAPVIVELLSRKGHEVFENERRIISEWMQSRAVFDWILVDAIDKVQNDCRNDMAYHFFSRCVNFMHEYWVDIHYNNHIRPNIEKMFPHPLEMVMRTTRQQAVRFYFRKHNWRIIRIPENRFVTSDQLRVDFKSDKDETYDHFLPISPNTVIYISNWYDTPVIDDQMIVRINNDLKVNARHFWIHNKSYRP